MRYFQDKISGLIQPENTLPYDLILKDRKAQESEEKLTKLENEMQALKNSLQEILGK